MFTLSNSQLGRLLQHFAQTEQFAFFDTARVGEDNSRSYLFEAPQMRLTCRIEEDASSYLREIESWLESGYYAAGWFGYEFGPMLLGRGGGLTNKPAKVGQVVADFGIYPSPYCFDHTNGNCDFPFENFVLTDDYQVDNLNPNVSREEYLEALSAVLEYIRAGDTYQVNYTLKLFFELIGSPEAMYRELRRNQTVSYGSFIRWGSQRVLSFSPELFFRKHHHGLTVRPMKGTLSRGRNSEEDAQACLFLHNDQKNRSENVMIVDLLRNDLGRVLHEAGGGEVKVRSLFDVEPYESLLQMTSTIDGLPHNPEFAHLSLATLFEALFPCGSVTGAPKIRTMEIIEELEKEPRGVYTGAIGFFTPDKEAVFNVPIRTVVLNDDQGEMGIGSGITHDSIPEEEWRECLLKGSFLTRPVQRFSLFETLLWSEQDGFWLLEEHLERLAGSAHYFSFVLDTQRVIHLLEDHVRERSGAWRVRLTLEKDGEIQLHSTPCTLPEITALPAAPDYTLHHRNHVIIAEKPIASTVPWFMHKTTNREFYEQQFKLAREVGAFDCILFNEHQEVTEGTITNLIIHKGGRYYTPPVECGLLAGTMRAMLLRRQAEYLEEKVLSLEDIREAEALFLCNSVRGVVPVHLQDGAC